MNHHPFTVVLQAAIASLEEHLITHTIQHGSRSLIGRNGAWQTPSSSRTNPLNLTINKDIEGDLLRRKTCVILTCKTKGLTFLILGLITIGL